MPQGAIFPPQEQLGVYIQPLVQGRGCHVEFSLFFDKDDMSASRSVQNAVYRRLGIACAARRLLQPPLRALE